MQKINLSLSSGLSEFYSSSAQKYMPGLLISITIAFAASFISNQYNGPAILYALILGMAFHFLLEDQRFSLGVQFAASHVLRFGVALLGMRITMEQLFSLNGYIILTLCGAVVCTILFGWLLARLFKLPTEYGILSGCSVGICGASAALAVSSVLPQKRADLQHNTVLTILGVTSLSTIAMVLYPVVASMLNFTAFETSVFLGGAIHDVAQVAGAGYMVSEEVGDTAIIIKLLRVTLLLPIVLMICLSFQQQQSGSGSLKMSMLLPNFLIAFVCIVILNSFQLIPYELINMGKGLSAMCLIIAIAALGIKTSFKDIIKSGWTFMLIMTAETIFIALFIIAALLFMPFNI